MSLARAEMDTFVPGLGQRRSAVAMDELLRACTRLPLDRGDREAIMAGFTMRMKAGCRLSPMPLEPGLDEVCRETKRAFIEQTAPQGFAFVTALDLGVSLLIVKTDAGRGFWGRQKATYTCFVSESSDDFERAGVLPTITKAFGIIDGFYQIQAAVNRALA